MAQRSVALGNSRYRVGCSQRAVVASRGAKVPGDLERKYFEYDRKIVAGVLDTLQAAVNEGAAQMEMVADERMFDKSLSGTLSRASQHLHRIAGKLEKLLQDVGNATGYPEMARDLPAARAVVRRLPNRQ